MWNKTRSSWIYVAAILALGMIAGCAALQETDVSVKNNETEVKAPNAEFTTEGKPTKTIETPWGPREIYDPAQDGEVRLAIENLYLAQDTSFGDVSRSGHFTTITEPRNIDLIKTARRVHYFDMLRLGCRLPVEIPCQYFGTLYLKKACPTLSFGSSKLNACEQESVTTDYTEIPFYATIPPKKRDHLKGENPIFNPTPYTCTIGGIENDIRSPLYIGAVSGYSLEETTRLLTTVECLDWPDSFKN